MTERERTADGFGSRGRGSDRSALPRGDPANRTNASPVANALGALASTAVLGVAAGIPGVVAGVLLWLTSFWLRPIFVFAAGQFALLALFPEGVPLGRLVLVEAGLLGTLAGAVVRTSDPSRTVVATLLAFLGLGALVRVGRLWSDTVWIPGALLIASVMTLSYGLHRYELLLMGLVGGELDE